MFLTNYTAALKHANLSINLHLDISYQSNYLKNKIKDLASIRTHLNNLQIAHESPEINVSPNQKQKREREGEGQKRGGGGGGEGREEREERKKVYENSLI